MFYFVLVLVTPTYTATLSTYDTLAHCLEVAPQVKKGIVAPPITVKNPLVLCLPKFDPPVVTVPMPGGADAPSAQDDKPANPPSAPEHQNFRLRNGA